MVASHKISHLTIEGFMSIQKLDRLELRDLNVLIGPNGAGKSNFVSFFYLLREMVEGRLQNWISKRGGSDRILTYGIKQTSQFKSRIDFGQNGYEFILRPNVEGKLYFEDERLLYSRGSDDQSITLGSDHFESRLKSEIVPHAYRRADNCYAPISDWRVFHFHDTSRTASVRRKGELQDNAYLRSDASNLAAYLYRLKRRRFDKYEQVIKVVRLAIPFFDDFDLAPEEIRPDEYLIQLTWRQIGSDYPLLPSQLSDGSIHFICLVTALLQPAPPSTIVIDEPEIGLHPYAIHLLGSLLRSASQRMQVIVATQSSLLLDEFDVDDLIAVELENGVSVFKRLEEENFQEWLKDFSVGELWHKDVLGGGIP